MNLATPLKRLGLTPRQIRVYITLLEQGEFAVQDLSKILKIHRATLYIILDELVKKGLVTTIKHGKKNRFVVTSPSTLLTDIKQKEIELEDKKAEILNLLPQLNALYSSSGIKPNIKFYEGITGLEKIYDDTLAEGKDLYALTAVHVGMETIGNKLNKDFIPLRKKANIMAYVIAPDTPEAKEYKSKDKDCFRETKLIPLNDFPFTIEMIIYAQKVAFISFKGTEMVGIIMESKEISSSMKAVFDIMWNKQNKPV